MSRLDRYIFRATVLPFLLILACATAVAWLTQVLQRMDIIVDDGGTVLAFLKITMLLIPSLVGLVIPIALLAASLYLLNVLMVDSEIPVMRAAGASRFRIARPLLLLSVLAAFGVYAINLDLQPRSYREMRQTIWDVRSNIASSLVRDRVFTEVTPGVTLYAEEVRPGDQYIGLHIYDARDPEKKRTITAENGLLVVAPEGSRLFLLRGTSQFRDPKTGEIEIVSFVETNLSLDELEEDNRRTRPWESSERYVGELLNPDLERWYDETNQSRFRAEGHARLATPLYAPAFALIAAAFMLTATTTRRGYGKRLLYASATAGAVRIAGFLVQSLADGTAVFNYVQYAVPIAAIIGSTLVLMNPKSFTITNLKRRQKRDLFSGGAEA